MQEAGYSFDEPWNSYVILVDFVKLLASDDNCPDDIWINREAREILKRIGE